LRLLRGQDRLLAEQQTKISVTSTAIRSEMANESNEKLVKSCRTRRLLRNLVFERIGQAGTSMLVLRVIVIPACHIPKIHILMTNVINMTKIRRTLVASAIEHIVIAAGFSVAVIVVLYQL
jgi:hypothetical protein